MQDAIRRRELAALLRHHRQATDPATVGLPTDPARRQPGLRREEIAVLSGVGLTWYTWLEQARPVNPSAGVIDALARVFGLDPDAHDHLRRLASLPPITRRYDEPLLGPELDLLDALSPSPAYLSDDHWNVLAWNPAEAFLLPELDAAAEDDRNIVWLLFTAPTPRQTMPDWESEAHRVLAQLRAQHATRLDDPAELRLIERLQAASPEFRNWWPEPDVTGFRPHPRLFQHPDLGPLRFHQHKLASVYRPDLRLTVYTAADPATSKRISRRLAASSTDACRSEPGLSPAAQGTRRGAQTSLRTTGRTSAVDRSSWCSLPFGLVPVLSELSDQAG